MRTLLIALLVFASAFAQAQQSPGPSAPAPTPTIRRDGLIEPFNPGWSTRNIHNGIGFGTSFMNASVSNFIYDHYEQDSGYSVYLGFAKTADSYSTSSAAVTAGTATTITTTTETRAGARNPFLITIGGSYNRPIFRNEWIMIRWGFYGGVDYYFKTSYDTGSHAEAVDNSNGNTTVTDSAYGSVTINRDPAIKAGPILDSLIFLRWFPQIAVGMQGGMLYMTPAKTTSDVSTKTRVYQRIGGVDQTPTSYSENNTRGTSDPGSQVGTFAVAGSQFNLFGNFVLRYVW